METKIVKIPFDLKIAEDINNNIIDGKILTSEGSRVEIIDLPTNEDFHLLGLVYAEDNTIKARLLYNNQGENTDTSPYNLHLELPEYYLFKKGDVLQGTSISGSSYLFIYENTVDTNGELSTRVGFDLETDTLVFFPYDAVYTIPGDIVTKATIEEINILIKALKDSKDPKAREILNNYFNINSFKFKPFDKVVVRFGKDGYWEASLFSYVFGYEGENFYFCIGGYYTECLPFTEQTAKLIGTTDAYINE